MSGAKCRLFAYGPADATTSQNPVVSCLIYIQTGYAFRVAAYIAVVVVAAAAAEFYLLNGCTVILFCFFLLMLFLF